MPNGKEMIDEMDFKQRMKLLGDRELSEFIAEQVWEKNALCQDHDKRLCSQDERIISLEGAGKRGALSGGVTGGIVGTVIALLEYFKIGR